MLNIIPKLQIDKTLSILLIMISLINNAQSDIDSLKAITASTENDTVLANTYNKLSYEYQFINQDSSIALANKALYHAKTANSNNEMVAAYKNLGRIHAGMNQVDIAIEYFRSALRLDSLSGNRISMGKTLTGLGNLYGYLGNNTMSETLYKQAVEIYREQSYSRGLSTPYINLGMVYLSRKEYDSAIYYFNQYISLFDDPGPDQLAQYHLNMGDLYVDEGKDLGKAMENLKLAANYATDSDNLLTYWWAILYQGQTYYQMNEFEKALKILDEGIDIIEEYGIGDYQNSYELYSKVYEANGDYKNALHYNNLLISITDSLYSEDAQLRAAEFQALYKTVQKENEIAILQKENEIQRLLNINQTIIIVVISVVILLLVIYFLIRAKRFREEKNKLNEEINQKDKELAGFALYLANKNDSIQKLSADLEKQKSGIDTENQGLIETVVNDLNQKIMAGSWEEFENRFSIIHPGFFKSLKSKHDNLNQNDLKMCSLLRLNLSSKEIASIINITPPSVDVSRSRLRKKLNISPDENLVEYLIRF